VAAAGSPLITRHGDEVAQAYLAAIVAASGALPTPGGTTPPSPPEIARSPALNVVYTPMHGVAGQLMLRALRLAGFAAPHVVAAQAEPDPDFPTVAFPNPEEPGALDLALADARRLGADLVVASDPDGDRLAVAVPAVEGWRMLTGDQVGALLGASLLERTAGQRAPEARLVASTVVSSTLLAKIAAAAGVRYAETLTGFKWIARAADNVPEARFVFGYEEALGYAVGDVVRDKDGFGAALAMLRLAEGAKSAGRSVLDVYDDLERAHGVHLTSPLTLRTTDQAQVMRRLRAAPPDAFGGERVADLTDLAAGSGTGPRADVLIFRLAGGRVVLRPSGTEPKIKCYIEITEPLDGRPLAAARQAAAGRLAPLRTALEAMLAGA
jgi:phosphomannomutase